jgi:hypothetical protein
MLFISNFVLDIYNIKFWHYEKDHVDFRSGGIGIGCLCLLVL